MFGTAEPEPILAGVALVVTAVTGGYALIYSARKSHPEVQPANGAPAGIIPVPSPDAAEVWVAAFTQLDEAHQRADAAEAERDEARAELDELRGALEQCNDERLALLREAASQAAKRRRQPQEPPK